VNSAVKIHSATTSSVPQASRIGDTVSSITQRTLATIVTSSTTSKARPAGVS